mgnify:CR=1 FL=1
MPIHLGYSHQIVLFKLSDYSLAFDYLMLGLGTPRRKKTSTEAVIVADTLVDILQLESLCALGYWNSASIELFVH